MCVCVPQVCTDEGEGAGECINLPQISTVVLGLSQPSSHLNNMMPLFPQMLLRGSFLPPLPLPEPAPISLAPSYPVALPFHQNDEMDVRWSCEHQRTLSSRRLLVTEQANSRRSTQGRAQERAYERKEVPSSNKGKKDYWTSKSVAHARISGESRRQSRSTPSAVLEDTMHLVDLFLSAFAPSWIAKGSMRSISIAMTIAHPAAQVH